MEDSSLDVDGDEQVATREQRDSGISDIVFDYACFVGELVSNRMEPDTGVNKLQRDLNRHKSTLSITALNG